MSHKTIKAAKRNSSEATLTRNSNENAKMQANHSRNQNRKAAEVLLKGLESTDFVPVLELRIRTALTISHEKFGNQSKANG